MVKSRCCEPLMALAEVLYSKSVVNMAALATVRVNNISVKNLWILGGYFGGCYRIRIAIKYSKYEWRPSDNITMQIFKLVYRTHALKRMAQRDIGPDDIERALEDVEIIESYPDDTPYPSYLVMGWSGKGRCILLSRITRRRRKPLLLRFTSQTPSYGMPASRGEKHEMRDLQTR